MKTLLMFKGPRLSVLEPAQKGVGLVTAKASALQKIDQKQVLALLDSVVKNGLPSNKERFRHLQKGIYELKTKRGIRIFCFVPEGRSGNVLVLTSLRRKPKPKVLKTEIERAKHWRDQYNMYAHRGNIHSIF